MPAPRSVRVTIHDLRGAVTRVLADREFAAGRHALSWDGLDARGRRAPPGIYFIRTRSGGEASVRRIVLVP